MNDTREVESARCWIRAGALLLGSLLATGMLYAPAFAGEEEDGWRDRDNGPVVETAEGPVMGFERNGVFEFLGIPYAAPPTGSLRWMPPQPVAHWSEPLQATKFANTCAQVTELVCSPVLPISTKIVCI